MLKWFADRLAETGKEARKDERGFTLIELLVVIIIIGILAAIAIPTFLAQRENARVAALESDVRNASAAATACSADNDGSYSGCTIDNLASNYDFNQTDGVNFPSENLTATDGEWTITGVTHDDLPAGYSASFSTTGDNSGQVVVTEPEE